MKYVSASDVDQLVLGHIAEQRYFQTRNKLFDESPYLPAKVPILQLFGDISSENRLHTILEEYVSLKTKERTPICALCNESDSVSTLWDIYDKVTFKIRKSHFELNSRCLQHRELTSTVHEDEVVGMQRFSPMQLYPDNNASNGASMIERKMLNPISNEYEVTSPEKNKSGSAKRKSNMLPKRNRVPVHDENLASLLHASDHNDALALVGVKILSNMKKCVGKGNSAPPEEMDMHVDPPQEEMASQTNITPTGSGLDVEDLISDETREGLVEMTIESLMNPAVTADIVPPSDLPNSGDDFFELRKLLDFQNANSTASIGFNDIVQLQSQQDERDLMDIIKGDDDIPDKPPCDAVPPLIVDNPDEKDTVTDIHSVQTSPATDELPHENAANAQNVQTELPVIQNIRSALPEVHGEICNQESRSSHISFCDLRNIDPDDFIDACANMPPKKRFLVKENIMTPEKLQGRSYLHSQLRTSADASNSSTVPEILLNPPSTTVPTIAPDPVEDVTSKNRQDETVPELVCISNEASKDDNILSSPPKETNVEIAEGNDSTRHILEDLGMPGDGSIRRSKRQIKQNIALKNLVPRPKSKSTKKSVKSDSSKKKGSSEKKSKKNSNKSKKSDSSKAKLLQPEQGNIVLNLKNKGQMPINVPGIIVAPEDQHTVSKEDIVKNLINQLQQVNKEKTAVAPASLTDTSVISNNSTPNRDAGYDAGDSDALMIDEGVQNTGLDADYVANTVLRALEDFSKEVPIDVCASPQLLCSSPMLPPGQHSPQVSDSNVQCEVEIQTGLDESITPVISGEFLDDSHDLNIESSDAITTARTTALTHDATVTVSHSHGNGETTSSTAPISHDLIMDTSAFPLQEPAFPNDADSTRDRIRAFQGRLHGSELLETTVPVLEKYDSSLLQAPNDEALMTPPKRRNLNVFSTISPSSGIFSVINNDSSRFTPNGKKKSAKSNLLSSFLMEKSTDLPLPLHDELTAMDQNRTESLHSQKIQPDNAAIVDSLLAESSELTGSAKSSKPQGKQTSVKKTGGSGVIAANQSKSMVRAEPKTHGASVVKRCLVQSSAVKDVKSRRTRSGRVFGKEISDKKMTEKVQSMQPVFDRVTNEYDAGAVPSKTDDESSVKRKKPSKAKEKRKKSNRTAGYPLINWSYEEIQAKLDAIHGKKDKTDTVDLQQSVTNSSNLHSNDNQDSKGLQECTSINQGDKCKDKVQTNLSSSGPEAGTNLQDHVGGQDCLDDGSSEEIFVESQHHLQQEAAHTSATGEQNTPAQVDQPTMTCNEIPMSAAENRQDLTLDQVGTFSQNLDNNQTAPEVTVSTQSVAKGQNFSHKNGKSCEDRFLEAELQLSGQSTRLGGTNERCDQQQSDPRNTLGVEIQSKTTDFPLPDWARGGAPQGGMVQVTTDKDNSQNTRKQCERRPNDENLSNKSVEKSPEKQKKSKSISRRKSKFSSLEKQIKKMDISKFLDSLEYEKIS